jgi:hypothetical protein
LNPALDDGIVVERSERSVLMKTLLDSVHEAGKEWRDDVWERSIERFEQRLAEEISTVRLDVTGQLADARVEIIRWLMVFWITQLGAMAGLLAYMK